MKKILILLTAFGFMMSSCSKSDDLLSAVSGAGGVKELLKVSADTSVTKGSVVNGYLANEAIKILLPDEVQSVVSNPLLKPLIGNFVDNMITQMNRAAEKAAVKAGPIIKDAVDDLSFVDVWQIISGKDDAATQYLKDKSFVKLSDAFYPDIEEALKSVGAQSTWETFTQVYNLVFPSKPLETNLAKYTTDKALDGLFVMMAEQEGKIRTDPTARVSSVLQELFGN